MVTYVGPTVLKRKLFSKLQQFWAEKQLSLDLFFIKKESFYFFLCEPFESPKEIGGDKSDEPVTHCTEFL